MAESAKDLAGALDRMAGPGYNVSLNDWQQYEKRGQFTEFSPWYFVPAFLALLLCTVKGIDIVGTKEILELISDCQTSLFRGISYISE